MTFFKLDLYNSVVHSDNRDHVFPCPNGKVTRPRRSDGPSFLPCIECEPKHKWTINIIDHHTKFVNVHPINNKLADEVLNEVQKYCVTYGYPQKILTDNGGELKTRK